MSGVLFIQHAFTYWITSAGTYAHTQTHSYTQRDNLCISLGTRLCKHISSFEDISGMFRIRSLQNAASIGRFVPWGIHCKQSRSKEGSLIGPRHILPQRGLTLRGLQGTWFIDIRSTQGMLCCICCTAKIFLNWTMITLWPWRCLKPYVMKSWSPEGHVWAKSGPCTHWHVQNLLGQNSDGAKAHGYWHWRWHAKHPRLSCCAGQGLDWAVGFCRSWTATSTSLVFVGSDAQGYCKEIINEDDVDQDGREWTSAEFQIKRWKYYGYL